MRAFIAILLFSVVLVFAQNPPRPEIDLDKFVQDLFGQQNGDAKFENIYEAVFQYYRYPLDLNKATRDDLENLYQLSTFQINELLAYKKKNGVLLTIYELQAVPGFDKSTIEKLLPFVKVQDDGLSSDSRGFLKRLLSTGEDNNYFIARYERTVEQQKGFSQLDSSNKQRFLGDPNRYYGRFRAYQKGDFSAGLTFEKDIGEQLAWNPSKNQLGFDYYSAHLAVFNKGIVKAAVIGDYQVQIGQGLVMSAGFYIGKGAETVSTVKRSNQGIRPYTAALEANFLRGAAATINFGRFDWTNFASIRALDGTIRVDTASSREEFASTILRSGFHRTATEIAAKNTLQEQLGGTHLLYQSKDKNFKFGLNGIFSQYSPEIIRINRLYNQFDFQGKFNYNIGADFTYNWQNFSFFGEYSRSKSGGNGAILGFISSLSAKIDFSLLYRSYDPSFVSFYGNSFGEISTAKNEQGLYFGLKYSPSRKINFSTFFDKFSFPWLTNRADAPSEGFEYLLRLNWMPTKKISLYAQIRDEYKQFNQVNNTTNLDFLADVNRRNIIFNIDYKAEKIITLKSKVQFTQFTQENSTPEDGIALIQDINFDFAKKFKISTRFAIFDATNFNTRLYVYEKNVLYAFSLPLYYGQGVRNYILLQYKATRNLDLWLRLARFDYRNTDNVSSGLNEIDGNTKTDVTMQLKYDF